VRGYYVTMHSAQTSDRLCINLLLNLLSLCSPVGADRMNVWDYADTVILAFGGGSGVVSVLIFQLQ
jgi:hypothetical protein